MRRTVLTGFTTLALVGAGAIVALPAHAAQTLVVSNAGAKLDPGTCTVDASGSLAPYTTIGDAVAAAADSGDTILVCAGTYLDLTSTTKSITFWGAQHGQDVDTRTDPSAETIIDTHAQGDSFDLAGAGSILDGFTLRASGPGAVGLVQLNADSEQVLDTIFDGLEAGVFVDGSQAIIDGNHFTAPDPSATSNTRYGVRFGGGSNGARVSGNVFDGKFQESDVDVDGRSAGVPVDALTVENNTADLTDGGDFAFMAATSNSVIQFNKIEGATPSQDGVLYENTNTNFRLNGNELTGLSSGTAVEFSTGNDDTISGTIESNAILGNDTAIKLSGASTGSVTVDSNILAGDLSGGVVNDSALAVNAVNNFWGCNEGPTNTAACDKVTNTSGGSVTFDPWIVLRTEVGASSIVQGTTTSFEAALTRTSAGTTVSPAVISGVLIANFSFTKGTADPTQPTFNNGIATTTLTGTTVGAGTAKANVANAESDDVVTVTAPASTTLPALTIHDASIAEGNSGTHALTFKVTLGKKSTKAVTVHFTTANGSAVAGSDFVAKSGTLTIAKGKTTGSITIMVKGDKAKEGNETFFVNIFNPTNARIADPVGQGTIRNDDH